MTTIRRARPRARHFVLSLSAALLVVAGGASAAGAAQIDAPSNQLQVWNLNTHGMDAGVGPAPNNAPPPRTDYREFISFITKPTRVAYLPDVITLQESGTNTTSVHTAPCSDFASRVQTATGHGYLCYQTQQTGGAAIVYRADRLTPLAVNQNVRLDSVVTPTNQQPGETVGSCPQKDWYALVVLFQDKRNTAEYSAIESAHLPTTSYTDASGVHDCVWENSQIVNSAVNNSAVKMQVMAGDWNHRDGTATGATEDTFQGWECWYKGVNALVGTCGGSNLGWRDGIYDGCSGSWACLHPANGTFIPSDNTNTKRRIDFVFTKAAATFNPKTVWWSDAYADAGSTGPIQYSDHRGQGELVQYKP
ncbi:MAG: endonuclease/exonuclease/phosphatase family protein [Thermoleophilaceae bacterium]